MGGICLGERTQYKIKTKSTSSKLCVALALLPPDARTDADVAAAVGVVAAVADTDPDATDTVDNIPLVRVSNRENRDKREL